MIKLRLPAHKKLKGDGEKEFTPGMVVQTTVGRVVFNDILHAKMPFYNLTLGQKQLQGIIADCYQILGRRETIACSTDEGPGLPRVDPLGPVVRHRRPKTPATKDAIIAEAEKEVAKATTSSTSAGSSPTRSGTTRSSTPGPTPASGSPPR